MVDPAEKSFKQLAHDYLAKALNLGLDCADGVDAVVNAIWYTTKDDTLSEHDMLLDLSVLAGMSCAALHSYAEILRHPAVPSEAQIDELSRRLFETDCMMECDAYTMGRSTVDAPRGYKTEVSRWQSLARAALTR